MARRGNRPRKEPRKNESPAERKKKKEERRRRRQEEKGQNKSKLTPFGRGYRKPAN